MICSPKKDTTEPPTCLKLSRSLTIDNVEDVLRELTVIIATSKDIVIDCHGLHELDEKGLKFLCSAHRHIVSRNRTVKMTGLSSELVLDVRRRMDRFVPGLTCRHAEQVNCVWKL